MNDINLDLLHFDEEIVLDYLLHHDWMSNRHATVHLCIGSPTKTISKLRKRGLNISDRFESFDDENGVHHRYKLYHLEDKL